MTIYDRSLSDGGAGQVDFTCDRCKRKGTTALRQGLVRLPAVYVLRLNRVNFDQVKPTPLSSLKGQK